MFFISFSNLSPLEIIKASKTAKNLSKVIANKQAGTAPKKISLEFNVAIHEK